MTDTHALVGVAILVIRDNDGALLLGQRKGGNGDGTWSLPGGHVDVTDASVRDAARRELHEETGIRWSEMRSLSRHTFTHFREVECAYVTLYYTAQVPSHTKPRIMEPDKCSEWRWVLPDSPWPGPLFAPFENLLHVGVDPWRP